MKVTAYRFMDQILCFVVEELIATFFTPAHWNAGRQFDSRIFLAVGETMIDCFRDDPLASAPCTRKVPVAESRNDRITISVRHGRQYFL